MLRISITRWRNWATARSAHSSRLFSVRECNYANQRRDGQKTITCRPAAKAITAGKSSPGVVRDTSIASSMNQRAHENSTGGVASTLTAIEQTGRCYLLRMQTAAMRHLSRGADLMRWQTRPAPSQFSRQSFAHLHDQREICAIGRDSRDTAEAKQLSISHLRLSLPCVAPLCLARTSRG
jgi:hypothetical protein